MTYWEKRQTEKYRSGEKLIIDYYRDLEKAFEQARREVRDVIDAFYGRYAKENGLSYTDALKRLSEAEIGDLKLFIDRINETMGTYDLELTNMSIKARVSRYEALEKQIDAILQKLYAVNYEKLGTETLGKAYEDSYYHTWWNIDTQSGNHNAFSSVDPSTIDQLIKYPFNGSNFSNRLWKQKDYLQGQLMESLTTMLIQGKNPKTLAKDFAKKFGSREYDAYRLLHTEYSYISEEASQAVYEEDGIEEYEYIATLDNRTCGICGDLDGRKIKIKAGVTGQNKPPMHPLCRCTTAPWIEGVSGGSKRIARDENGNNIKVSGDMKYPEWKKKFVLEPADEREYQNFKNVLDEHAPKTLDDFKSIKYNKKEEWSVLQREYSTISKIQNKETYSMEYRKKMIGSYYEFRDEGVEMTDHSLNRFLGQKSGRGKKIFTKDELVEAKRNKPNFRQNDGRLIHYYNSLAVVENENTGEVVTIVVRGKAKADWEAL